MRKRYPGKYKFKRHHRQYRAGDAVPDSMDDGNVGTMLAGQIIEPAEAQPAAAQPAAAKAVTAPPADKSMARRPGKIASK